MFPELWWLFTVRDKLLGALCFINTSSSYSVVQYEIILIGHQMFIKDSFYYMSHVMGKLV